MARGYGISGEDDKGGSESGLELIVGVILAAIVIIIIGFTYDKPVENSEDKEWNHGVCSICGTAWHYKDSVGRINSSRYIYECECGNHRIELYHLR